MTSGQSGQQVYEQVGRLYRAKWRRTFAALVGLLGDLDFDEDALQDAFKVIMEQWPRVIIPRNPRAWLVSAGRFKTIDAIRRRA